MVVCVPCIVLVDQIEWIPAEEDVFMKVFSLSICMEFLIWHVFNVNFDCISEALTFHERATIAKEINFTSTTN